MESSLERACIAHGITATVKRSNAQAPTGWAYGTKVWDVTLKLGKSRLTTRFHTGPGLKDRPTAADVLSCLLSDASSYRNAGHFGEWANDMGYDDDSRKAEAIYKACGKAADDLDTFFEGHETVREALESAEH